MARTAADVLADRLIDWGVRVVFGLPGDGINGIMEALRTRQDKIASSRSVMKKPPRSWRAATRNTPAGSASVSPPPGRARFIS